MSLCSDPFTMRDHAAAATAHTISIVRQILTNSPDKSAILYFHLLDLTSAVSRLNSASAIILMVNYIMQIFSHSPSQRSFSLLIIYS